MSDGAVKDMRRGDGEPVSFPRVYERAHGHLISRREFVEAVECAPIQRVPLDRIYATQATVDPKVVAAFGSDDPPIVKPGKRNYAGLLIDKPIVVKRDERYYMHDGHHRATGEKVRGSKDVEARVVDLDAYRPGLSAWARRRARGITG